MMLTNDYVVGLADGEGSFTVYVRNPDDSRKRERRVRAEPKFFVKLIEKDKVILDGLKDFFGCGSVYFQKDARANHQQCYRYEVSNREDLGRIIIPFFTKHGLHFPSKRKDFEIFCDLFARIKNGEHTTEGGLKNLWQIKQMMH